MHKGNKGPFSQRKPLVLAIAFAMAVSANSTMAQDAEEEFAGLEEVIVTATKRAESLQEVGMATWPWPTRQMAALIPVHPPSVVFLVLVRPVFISMIHRSIPPSCHV